jgi:hypothetical protein
LVVNILDSWLYWLPQNGPERFKYGSGRALP